MASTEYQTTADTPRPGPDRLWMHDPFSPMRSCRYHGRSPVGPLHSSAYGCGPRYRPGGTQATPVLGYGDHDLSAHAVTLRRDMLRLAKPECAPEGLRGAVVAAGRVEAITGWHGIIGHGLERALSLTPLDWPGPEAAELAARDILGLTTGMSLAEFEAGAIVHLGRPLGSYVARSDYWAEVGRPEVVIGPAGPAGPSALRAGGNHIRVGYRFVQLRREFNWRVKKVCLQKGDRVIKQGMDAMRQPDDLGAADIDGVLTAYVASREPYPLSPHLEERIYNGFPGPDDERRMRDFHQASCPDRLAIVQGLEDERLRWFGLRLMYADARGILPETIKAEIEHSLADQLAGDGSGCLTYDLALAETEKLMGKGEDHDDLLSRYRVYWRDRSSRAADFRAGKVR